MTEAVSKSPDDAERIAELEQTVGQLSGTIESLEQQLDWFKRQLFGRKSEKRLLEDNPHQPLLEGFEGDKPEAKAPADTETVTYTRKKQRGSDCVNDSGLRFDASVPMKTIRCTVPELEGDRAGEFEFIGEERTYRLAQRRSSYVVIEYVRPVIKRRGGAKPVTIPAPPSVFPGSLADVSLLAAMLHE